MDVKHVRLWVVYVCPCFEDSLTMAEGYKSHPCQRVGLWVRPLLNPFNRSEAGSTTYVDLAAGI